MAVDNPRIRVREDCEGRAASATVRFEPRGPRLGDAAFRAQRDALEQAEQSLKLAAQAHGEVLTQLLTAWGKTRSRYAADGTSVGWQRRQAGRGSLWAQAIGKVPQAAEQAATSLLRLEMAAEVPTPAEQQNERRMLQLQLCNAAKIRPR